MPEAMAATVNPPSVVSAPAGGEAAGIAEPIAAIPNAVNSTKRNAWFAVPGRPHFEFFGLHLALGLFMLVMVLMLLPCHRRRIGARRRFRRDTRQPDPRAACRVCRLPRCAPAP